MVNITSPEGLIWLSIQTRLVANCPALKFIDLDTGQLEYHDSEMRPAVLLPCALFDFSKVNFEDLSFNVQEGEGVLEVRTGVNPFTQATHYFTDTQKANALAFFDIDHAVYLALQGWSDSQYFGPLSRISVHTEKRNDKLRVRTQRFKFTYLDNSAIAVTTSVARPQFILNTTDQLTGIGS
jgi:hypothetical protein